ncbi:MAG: molybdopterin converting factor subunit 1 [Ketobacteraceae bacterium]|nr:molybdopterin converting factor subunit 1 [Ketobacteraceae bacterium]
MIRVQFFASIRESIGTAGTSVEGEGIVSVADLVDHLCTVHPHWEEALKTDKVLVALNQEMTTMSARVIDGDEVALFPPVTGG